MKRTSSIPRLPLTALVIFAALCLAWLGTRPLNLAEAIVLTRSPILVRDLLLFVHLLLRGVVERPRGSPPRPKAKGGGRLVLDHLEEGVLDAAPRSRPPDDAGFMEDGFGFMLRWI